MSSKVKNKVKDRGGRKPRQRARICVLLGSDLHHSDVAKRLGVSQAYISTQARILVKDKALIPIKAGRERFYRRGPNFEKYERLSMTDTWGVEPSPPVNRFHHISASCTIDNPKAINLDLIKWDRSWHPRPEQTYRKLVLAHLKATVIVHDKVSLNIWIHDVPDVPENPNALAHANNEVHQRIFDVVKHLCKTYGFALGLPMMNRKMHIAQEIPELRGIRTGKIILDAEGNEFIDDSLTGRPEHELTQIETAKQRAIAYKLIPDFISRLAEYIASNNRRQKQDEKVIETVLKIATEQNDRHNELLKRFDQLLDRLTPTEKEYEPKTEGDNIGYL